MTNSSLWSAHADVYARITANIIPAIERGGHRRMADAQASRRKQHLASAQHRLRQVAALAICGVETPIVNDGNLAPTRRHIFASATYHEQNETTGYVVSRVACTRCHGNIHYCEVDKAEARDGAIRDWSRRAPLTEIRTGDFVITREDAIKLCRDWQDYEWGKPHRHTADNIENAIEELCLAFGFTGGEVRATWWRNRRST